MIVTAGRAVPFDIHRDLHAVDVIAPQPRWRPDADVYETPGAVAIVVELAGVDEDTIDIAIFEDAVVIDGRRDLPCEESGVFYAAAIRQGPFRLEAGLPARVDPGLATAHYDGGLLRIDLPKAEGR